jgi:hypothetical protein
MSELMREGKTRLTQGTALVTLERTPPPWPTRLNGREFFNAISADILLENNIHSAETHDEPTWEFSCPPTLTGTAWPAFASCTAIADPHLLVSRT